MIIFGFLLTILLTGLFTILNLGLVFSNLSFKYAHSVALGLKDPTIAVHANTALSSSIIIASS